MPVQSTPGRAPARIFFHAGLGKAASTFLQYQVFPHFKGIYYIRRRRFLQHEKIIARAEHPSYLLSREFGRNFAGKIHRFAASHPHARIIMVLRRHDTWAASQYRRYVKNGGCADFERFLDLEHDNGVWKQEELLYYPRLELISRLFDQPPFVLRYEDLRQSPCDFIDAIAAYVGATYSRDAIDLAAAHPSYRDAELLLLQKINRRLFRRDPKPSESPRTEWIKRRLRMYFAYSILYPVRWLNLSDKRQDRMIPEESLQRVSAYYADDWSRCMKLAGIEK